MILGGKPLALPHSSGKEVEATVLLTTWPQSPHPGIRRSEGMLASRAGRERACFFGAWGEGLLSVMKS